MSLLLGPLRTAGRYSVRRELFSNNEQGLWLDPSDMNATKAGWRRNLFVRSQEFDSSSWAKVRSSISANATTAPDGSLTADKLVEDTTANSSHVVAQNVSVTPNSTYTLSFYAKAAERTWVFTYLYATGGMAAFFDLSNGAVGNTFGAVTTTITSAGNGWYRCTISGQISGSTADVWILTSLANSQIYTGDGTSGIFIWGAQLELGSTPSEYQRITDFSTEFKAAFPTHTLYQDSNGVTPCTAAGDPVGLILDQSRGGLGALGPELVTNGGFDSDTWWTKDAGIAITGGQAVFTSVAGGNGIYRSGFTVAGKWYRVTFTIASISSGSVRAYVTDTSFGPQVTSPGTYQHFILANSSNNLCGIFAVGTTSCTIDNISVREVPGNHAYQTTSGQRPTLARIPSSGRRNVLTYSEQLDNAAWTKSVATATANTHAAFDGTTTADTLEDTGSGGYGVVSQSYTFLNVAYTFAIDIRKTSGTPASFPGIQCGPASIFHIIHTTNGTVSSTAGGQTCTVTSLDSNWWRVVVNFTPTAGADRVAIFPAISSDSTTLSTAAVGTVIVSRAQLELGSSATNYQKVVATTDVTESGVGDLWHLVFDGSDDSLVTNSISFDTWTQETRRNLLVDTESFAAATWTKIAVTANDNATTDPNGGNTACRLVETTSTSEHRLDPTTGLSFTSGLTYTVSIYAKAAERTRIRFGFSELFQMPGRAYFDLSNGTTDNAIAGTTAAIENAGNGWYRCSVTCTCTGNVTSKIEVNLVSTGTTINYTGDTANGVLIWGAQVDTGTLTTYQRVGTDEMTVIAGVRKLSDSIGMIVETSIDQAQYNGAFLLHTRSAPNGYRLASHGNTSFGSYGSNDFSVYASPISNVVTGRIDLSQSGVANKLDARVNGAAPTTETEADTLSGIGSGNFGNYQMFIGRRNQSNFPYNGHLYQLIIRGKTTPTGKLLEAERFVAKRTGVTGI